MDIRQLTQDFAVSPQIEIADVAALAEQGFRTLIINRPDPEIGPDLQSDAVSAAAREAGMAVHYLPYFPGNLTPDLVEAFNEALETAQPRVMAYCRSGTRSSHLWALSQAGKLSADEIVAAGASAGYDLRDLLPLIADLAARRGATA